MRAIRFRRTGSPAVLTLDEVDEPVAKPEDVLVAVKAIGVNFADVHFRKGEYFQKPSFPDTPGLECAGVVAGAGRDVVGLREGDRVLAFSTRGAYAERLVVPAAFVFPMPDALSFEDAATVGVQGLTATHLLGLAGRFVAGESVLVHAGAGGVGSLAIQLARLGGAGAVIATASSEAKRRVAQELGASLVLDARDPTFRASVRTVAPKGVDLVLEMTGGSAAYETDLACLAPFGRLVVYGAADGDTRGSIFPVRLMSRNLSVVGYYLTQALRDRALCAAPLDDLFARVTGGQLRLLRHAVLSLAEASKAHELLEARASVGKIVLVP